MASKSLIISGPDENYDIPKDVSLGKFIIENLKKRRRDEVVNMDGITGDIITCGELMDQSLKVVMLLKSLNIKKGDTIAIIADTTIYYCVPVVATLYMGVIAHLINPAYTIGELKHALLISKPNLVFCQKTVLQTIQDLGKDLACVKDIILLDRSIGNVEKQNDVKILEEMMKNVALEPDSKQHEKFNCDEEGAFILMSSGTTGLPKGALLTHGNFRLPIGVTMDPRYGDVQVGKEVVLTAIPMFHVLGLTIQILAIISRSKLIIMSRFVPDAYLRNIERHLVTCLPLVPPILLFLAKSPLVVDYDFTAVQKILCGAAPLGKETEERMGDIVENASVQQVYGLTETAGMCTFSPSEGSKPGSVGTLLPGVQGKVWDPETGETLGPSKTGELCFKGPVIMKQYVGISVNDIDNDDFYHTGDIGYYDEDGFFFITGRIKELIKYKGFQVAPVELENLILTNRAVKDCAVIGIDDEIAGEVPLAFVVLQAGATATEKEIVDFVAGRISVQKRLYGGVRFINEIPKSPTGKILRNKLVEVYKSL